MRLHLGSHAAVSAHTRQVDRSAHSGQMWQAREQQDGVVRNAGLSAGALCRADLVDAVFGCQLGYQRVPQRRHPRVWPILAELRVRRRCSDRLQRSGGRCPVHDACMHMTLCRAASALLTVHDRTLTPSMKELFGLACIVWRGIGDRCGVQPVQSAHPGQATEHPARQRSALSSCR